MQCCAFASSIVTRHLDLIYGFPSCFFLHLIDHVLEFDRADIATEEHALSLDFFPVVAPRCLADCAAFLSYFQTVYSSPSAPSSTGRSSQSIEETWLGHHPSSPIFWNISPQDPGLLQNAPHPLRTLPAGRLSLLSIFPCSSRSPGQNIRCSHPQPSIFGSLSVPARASLPSLLSSGHPDRCRPRPESLPVCQAREVSA